MLVEQGREIESVPGKMLESVPGKMPDFHCSSQEISLFFMNKLFSLCFLPLVDVQSTKWLVFLTVL